MIVELPSRLQRAYERARLQIQERCEAASKEKLLRALKAEEAERQHLIAFELAENRRKQWKLLEIGRQEERERQRALKRILCPTHKRWADSLRGRVRRGLKSYSKAVRTQDLIGCKILELWQWLEFQFQPGMTRENYGPVWHVDHIRPCAFFDLTNLDQQKECFNYKNLQPLFALDNLRKGARYDEKS